MNTVAARHGREIQLNPVAAAIASLLALAAPSAALAANTWSVTSCADSGPGTLRDVIAAPTTLSGDSVNLNASGCGTIALTTSTITVNQDSLTIVGPGKGALNIDGSALPADGRVFKHTKTGTLDLRNLRVSGGQVYRDGAAQPALGGCIYSSGSVSLLSVEIDGCNATSVQDKAAGGGIYAKGTLSLTSQSLITGNSAYSNATGSNGARGGGVAVGGALTVTNSTISGNTVDAPAGFAFGGGALAGSAAIQQAEISGNAAISDHGAASGGGLSVVGNVSFDYSLLAGNSVFLANTGGGSGGGGASVQGNFSAKYSTIDSNQAIGNPVQTVAGGISVAGDLTIESSTLSNNSSSGFGGGLYAFDNGNGDTRVFLRGSTISGNHANWVGGLSSSHKHLDIYNSTIAFNTATESVINTSTFSPGLQVGPFLKDVAVKLQSSIVSNNTSGAGVEDDLGATVTGFTTQVTLTDSLVRASSIATLPTNAACPLLGPLRDNGGLTQTHALLSHSPVIDHGDAALIDPNTNQPYNFDQRGGALNNGVANYLRVSGMSADMGAYEVQQDEIIFGAGFDGCPDVP